ncbi:ABC transporter substrate-binding protein [Paraburkholderia jirisanensis]
MQSSRRTFLAQTAALTAGVYGLSKPAGAATPKAMVVVGQTIDGIVNGFDPAEAYDVSSETIGNLYRMLFTADPANPGQLTGDLAQSWSVSPDGTQYTFRLRPGNRFESGAPVTADDVVFSLQRVMRLNRAASFMLIPLGINHVNVDTVVRASAPDTVVLTLPQPRASGLVLATLSTTCAAVVDRKTVLANEKNADLGNAWLRTHSAGAGSYRLSVWQASDHIILDANPNAAIKPRTPRLAFRHMPEPATELLLLRRGDMDIGRSLGSDQLKTLAGDPGLNVIEKDALTLLLLQVNTAVPQFQKVEVRQAIKWAIDYDAIAHNITPRLWTVWQSLLPKGAPGAIGTRFFQHDVGKAKALMAQAGLAGGFQVTLDHPNTWPYVDIAQALQSDLGQIGIRVELLSGSNGQVLAKRRSRTHQMSLGRFGADHLDPSSFTSYYCTNRDDSANSHNRNGAWNAHFVDAKLNAAELAAQEEMDPVKRLSIYTDIQKRFAEVAPFIFLLQKRDIAVQRNGVSGISLGAVNVYTRFADVRKV